MLPITMLATQKLAGLLTASNAISLGVSNAAQAANINVPTIQPNQVVVSAASSDIGDRDVQLTYPRVCLYSAGLKNTQMEKFRSLSGSVSVVAEVWGSAALVGDAEQGLHFYVDAVTNILRANAGDWKDGFFYSGGYEVQFQAPKAGGFGFVTSAKVTIELLVSQN